MRTITADEAHLARCYDAVERIIAELEGRRIVGGDEYAEALIDFLRVERITRLRADDAPFFGRVDTDESEVLHIGPNALLGPDLHPLTISWRAPLAAAFYRASARQRHGATFRRRYVIAERHIAAYADEDLLHGQEGDLTSAIVAHVRNAAVGVMTDIMTTITPDQHEVIALPGARPLVVQGGPGTGKTAVGLHRAAYLLYQGGPAARAGMLVVGPTRRFVGYVEQVLPALGERAVEHLPFEAVGGARARVTLVDADATGLLGDERMRAVAERAVWQSLGPLPDELVSAVAGNTVRLTRDELEELRARARAAATGWGPARARFRIVAVDAIAAKVAARGSLSPDEAGEAFRATPEYGRLMTRIWPALSATTLLERLLTSRVFLARAAHGLLSAEEQRTLLGAVRKAPRPQRLPSVLAALRDTLAELLGDDLEVEFGHIVVDEAQDLSPLQVRMIARRARGRAVTLLGDFDQRTVATGNEGWESLLSAAGLEGSQRRTLRISYRVPSDVLAFAARLLPPDAHVPEGVRPADAPIAVVAVEGYPTAVEPLVPPNGTVGVICSASTYEAVRAVLGDAVGRVSCLPAEECKGLEFNHVLVVDPAGMLGTGERGTGRLYTALTRAITTLTVLHRGDLPEALR